MTDEIALGFTLEQMPLVVPPEGAPMIFCDGFQGIAMFNDVVRLNAFQLVQDLADPTSPPKRLMVARIAMSQSTLGQMITWLNDNVQMSQPVLNKEAASGDPT